jgi:hypothetical protein
MLNRKDPTRMDRRRHLDPEGYIFPEADLGKIQRPYDGLPDAAAALLQQGLGSRLHSGYLYGSIARGNAVPGRSDADLLAVLRAPVSDEDRRRARRVERALEERFPVLASAGIALTGLEAVRSPAERYGLQVFLRDLSVCVCGTDLRPDLPRTRPSAAVAVAFHADTPKVFARARAELATSSDLEVIRTACRTASRRMVQAAFAVVMARDGVWATVLEEQAGLVGAAFPRWKLAARRAAEQGRRRNADPTVVGELLETFGRWAEEALAQIATRVARAGGSESGHG